MEDSACTLISQKWSLCIFASFLGFLFMTFYHDQGQQFVTIFASFESLGSVDYKYLTTNTSTDAKKTNIIMLQSTMSDESPLQNSSTSMLESSPRPTDVQEKQLSPNPSAVVDVQEKHLSPNTSAVKDLELSSILSISNNTFPSTSDSTVSSVLEKSKEEEYNYIVSSVLEKLNEEQYNIVSSVLKKSKEEDCDIFDGKWVYDSKNYPLYHVLQCPFLSEQVSCQKNGRPDSDYERWRWEPRNCEIPRFNGTKVLETLRGKRIAIVGDSLNRNQWESLSCLLYSSIHPSRARINAHRPDKIFHALDYDFSLEFYWSPFLVSLNINKDGKKVLKLNKLGESRRWRDADIMVFNTGHWWTHRGRSKSWDYYEARGKLVEEMEASSAFEMAMQTWARWIDQTVNATKTKVFFRSISPEHKQWNLHWCHNQIQPITNETYKQTFPGSMVSIVEQTLEKMTTPVKYLNITRLSEYRRDAHTSVYTTRQGKLLTEEQRKQPQLYADCSHWCLPGLPDTWNVLLHASIVGTSSSILR